MGKHGGVDPGRQHGRHVDWLVEQLLAQALAEAADRELAEAVRARIGLTDDADHRADVDQRPHCLPAKVRQDRARTVNVAEQVGLDDPPVGIHRPNFLRPLRAGKSLPMRRVAAKLYERACGYVVNATKLYRQARSSTRGLPAVTP